MEAINYIMKNTAAANLIQYGWPDEYDILGSDDEGHFVFQYKVPTDQLEYYNGYGLWGDSFEMGVQAPNTLEYNKIIKASEEMIPEDRKSPALGYCFIQSSVSSQIAAVETVMEQYCYSMNAGALDPNTVLPEFIQALKSAGIDEIIAENQRQIDEWAKSK